MPNASSLECSAGPSHAISNPFDAHVGSLRRLHAQLGSNCLSTAHALTDFNRIMHDVVNAAATTFLLSPLPPPSTSLASLTHSAHSLRQSTESFTRRLRAACILSVDDSRQLDRMEALLARSTESAGYEVRQERVAELCDWLISWLQRLSDNCQLSTSPSALSNPPSSQFARVWQSSAALPVIASAAAATKPTSSWTDSEWTLHCQPLWNTAQLSLAQAEEEDSEKEKAAEDERKDILAQVKQREKEKRDAAKQKREAKQERQKQKAESAADRAKRLEEGEIDADDAKKEEEEEEAKDREDEAGEEEAKEEELQVPPPVVRHVPITFCCISCHSALLTPATIQRVHSNTVWSLKAAKVDALFKNLADIWEQEEEEEDKGRSSADDEEAEAEAAGDEQSADAGAQKRRRSTTAAVHCARCFAYVGRWFVKEEQFRLVYIDRLTGRNWMFVTGDEATIQNKLTPLLTPGKDETENEEQEAEGDEEDENGEKKPKPVKEEVIPVIVGLPTSYATVAQARQYPFPRFPVLAIAQTAATINDNFPPLPPSTVAGLMSASADPLYTLSTSASLSAQSLLLRSDPALHARVLLLLVSRNVERVFSEFSASAYASPSACPVPAFTHFYLNPPQFTHARGTARYSFHYLTQRDDSKVKRQQWSVKRVRDAQRKAGELSAMFVIAGGWGGMRAVVIKVAGAYRVLQSNELCRDKTDRYTLRDWVGGNSRWSRVLDEEEWSEWLGKYERARRGERAVWEELFCRGKSVEVLGCSQPQDSFKDSDCQFSISKLVLDHMTVE